MMKSWYDSLICHIVYTYFFKKNPPLLFYTILNVINFDKPITNSPLIYLNHQCFSSSKGKQDIHNVASGVFLICWNPTFYRGMFFLTSCSVCLLIQTWNWDLWALNGFMWTKVTKCFAEWSNGQFGLMAHDFDISRHQLG